MIAADQSARPSRRDWTAEENARDHSLSLGMNRDLPPYDELPGVTHVSHSIGTSHRGEGSSDNQEPSGNPNAGILKAHTTVWDVPGDRQHARQPGRKCLPLPDPERSGRLRIAIHK